MSNLKYDSAKVRLDLVEPNFICGIGDVLTFGAKKYKADSWKRLEDGRDRYYAAAMRHLMAYRSGEVLDEETGLSHLHHAATNLMFLAYYEESNNGL